MKRSYVLVKRYSDDSVVKRLGPLTARDAEKVKSGLSINLNHDDFYIELD